MHGQTQIKFTVVSVGPYVISASLIIYLKTGSNPVVLITLQMQDDRLFLSEERNKANVIYHYENPTELISGISFDVDVNNFDCNSKCVATVIVRILANFKFMISRS
jgi:hypothetical protein